MSQQRRWPPLLRTQMGYWLIAFNLLTLSYVVAGFFTSQSLYLMLGAGLVVVSLTLGIYL